MRVAGMPDVTSAMLATELLVRAQVERFGYTTQDYAHAWTERHTPTRVVLVPHWYLFTGGGCASPGNWEAA